MKLGTTWSRVAVICCLGLAACGNSHALPGDGGARRDGAIRPGDDGGILPGDDGGIRPGDDGGIRPGDDGGIRPGDDGGIRPGDDGGIRPGDDGGIRPGDDGGIRPGADGGGFSDGRIGTPCTSSDDCEGRFCSGGGSGLGYCSWVCAEDVPCPDDAVCVQFGPGAFGYCLVGCDPASPDCPRGTVCTGDFGLPEPVCLAGCTSDDDCPMGAECGMSFGDVGRCFTPGSTEGGPCRTSVECIETAFCADEESWGFAAGMCIRFGCDPFTDEGCADDQLCVDAEWGPICLPRCDAMSDCRSGYQCVSSPEPDVRVCLPRCTDHSQCTDGRRCDFLTSRCIDPED